MRFAVNFQKKKEEGWQGMRDSNSQHAVLETAALPIELIPFYLALFLVLLGGCPLLQAPPKNHGLNNLRIKPPG